jgi:hypothetical protein
VSRRVSIVAFLLFTGCFPSFEDRPWLVEDARILAIRGTPAEERPDQQVFFEALIASPSGTLTSELEWAYCLQPRRAEERTGVTASCLEGDSLVPISNPALIVSDACARFGPNPPPTEGDEPPARPADPDPSGGYFLPVRALTRVSERSVAAFGFQRIRCDLAGATRKIFDEYQANYVLNENPEIATLDAGRAGEPVVPLNEAATVGAGSILTLGLDPTAASTEPFVVYIAAESRLDYREEALTVSWYLTGGELNRASQTLSAEALATGARFETQWQAPDTPTEIFGWAVLRDSRGGSGWTEFSLLVQ